MDWVHLKLNDRSQQTILCKDPFRSTDERVDALLASLKAGRYYSSQGPEIRDIAIDGDEVVVRTSPARAISVVGRGSKSQSEVGDGIEAARLRIGRFAGSWFRVTVIDAAGRKAWSNPIWLA